MAVVLVLLLFWLCVCWLLGLGLLLLLLLMMMLMLLLLPLVLLPLFWRWLLRGSGRWASSLPLLTCCRCVLVCVSPSLRICYFLTNAPLCGCSPRPRVAQRAPLPVATQLVALWASADVNPLQQLRRHLLVSMVVSDMLS